MTKKKSNFKFSDKVHPRKGVISFILGLISFAMMIILFFISGKSGGNAGLIVGGIGVLTFLCAAIGLLLTIKSLKKKDIFYTFPLISLGLNGIVVVVCFVLYMMGIFV